MFKFGIEIMHQALPHLSQHLVSLWGMSFGGICYTYWVSRAFFSSRQLWSPPGKFVIKNQIY